MKRIRTTQNIQKQAQALRKTMTPAEQTLWEYLRGKQIEGLKFRRQHPLGPFIVDFYCAACRLVVEVDGGIHDDQQEADAARTEQLEAYGYRVIRFRNEAVLGNTDDVLAQIMDAGSSV
ncbi:MAG: endonuclease domain-containing protein [Chloroflexota bacterium]